MDPKPPSPPDILEVLDNALTAALKEVRRARARAPAPVGSPRTRPLKSTSRLRLCEDVLTEANRPLHATALIEALAQRGVQTTRDSLVSALSKHLSPKGPFVRTAGNTFGLAGRDG